MHRIVTAGPHPKEAFYERIPFFFPPQPHRSFGGAGPAGGRRPGAAGAVRLHPGQSRRFAGRRGLYLAWYNVGSAAFQSDQAPGPDQAFTDLYVKDGLVYLNVRQIYRTLLSGLSAQYPVITSLIPDWGLGDYITQTQLARLLGAEPAVAEMEQYSAAAFAPGQMQRVRPEGALDGYLYFAPQDTGSAEIVIGFPPRSLFAEFFTCHVLVELPGQGLHFELTGRALPGDYDIEAPASVMQDGDIDALAAIFDAVRSILAFVRQLSGAAQ